MIKNISLALIAEDETKSGELGVESRFQAGTSLLAPLGGIAVPVMKFLNSS